VTLEQRKAQQPLQLRKSVRRRRLAHADRIGAALQTAEAAISWTSCHWRRRERANMRASRTVGEVLTGSTLPARN
jgi:hypothetical protein